MELDATASNHARTLALMMAFDALARALCEGHIISSDALQLQLGRARSRLEPVNRAAAFALEGLMAQLLTAEDGVEERPIPAGWRAGEPLLPPRQSRGRA
jgi:hypothetical protein